MSIRIVKMTFLEEKISITSNYLSNQSPRLGNFLVVCTWNDCGIQKIEYLFIPIASDIDEGALELYRKSNFFQATWTQTKVFFEA